MTLLGSTAGDCRAFGETEHVRAQRMLCSSVALVDRKYSVWVYLPFKAVKERLACWPGAGASIGGAAP